jgi:hypothetical protein
VCRQGWPLRELSEVRCNIINLRPRSATFEISRLPIVTYSDDIMSAMGFINRLLGRKQSPLPPFDFARNRFRAKKIWPPNLSELTEKQQYHFERKFKRRTRLKSIKPQWNKWTKIVQWSLISFIIVHGVFFYDFANDPMNPRKGQQPFQGLRDKMWAILGNFYTQNPSTLGVPERGARRIEPVGSPRPGVEELDEARRVTKEK